MDSVSSDSGILRTAAAATAAAADSAADAAGELAPSVRRVLT